MKSSSSKPSKSQVTHKPQRRKGTTTSKIGKINTLATLAIIIAFFFPPAGLILGIVSLRQIKKSRQRGRKMAIFAVILSLAYLALLLTLIYLSPIKLNYFFSLNKSPYTFTSGDNAKLPKGFPSSIPLYPGAKLLLASEDNFYKSVYEVDAESPDYTGKIIDFYKSVLPANGWNLDSEDFNLNSEGLSVTLDISNDKFFAQVTLAANSGKKTTIAFNVFPKSTKHPAKNTVSIDGKIGTKVEKIYLPEGFPSSMPIYPGATITLLANLSGKTYNIYDIYFATNEPIDKVTNYYRSEFVSKGWNIRPDEIQIYPTPNGNFARIKASNAEFATTAIIGPDSSQKTVIIITYERRSK